MDLGLRWISNAVEREQCSKWKEALYDARCTRYAAAPSEGFCTVCGDRSQVTKEQQEMVQRTGKVDLSIQPTSDEGALDEVGGEHCMMHAVRDEQLHLWTMGAGQSKVMGKQHVNKELCTSQLSLVPVRGCRGLFIRAAIKRQSCSGDQKRLCFVENEIFASR